VGSVRVLALSFLRNKGREELRSTLWHPLRGDAAPVGRRTLQRIACMPVAGGHVERRGEGVQLPYLPGLDGMRALAVFAVLLYHAQLPWIPGGFLGVEVFFVISGYLITALLLAEWRQLGRINLKAFWLGRARRLLPALYLVLAVTLAYAVVFLPEQLAGLRNEAIAALGYVANWYLVFGHESYFEAVGRPSLLKHLWSLAVEEQFYLLWPPVLALGLSVGAMRWRQHRVLLVALVGAAIAALLMAILYRPEVDPSRIYYGTDTRAAGLLIGAALAFVWIPGWGFARGRNLSVDARCPGAGKVPKTVGMDYPAAARCRRSRRTRRSRLVLPLAGRISAIPLPGWLRVRGANHRCANHSRCPPAHAP
jgi:hypothetical protein